MRTAAIKSLERRYRLPPGRGKVYFRALDGGPLHRLDQPEIDLEFDEIQREDGPLSPMIFSATSIGDFELEEFALVIGHVGIHILVEQATSPGLGCEFWRGRHGGNG